MSRLGGIATVLRLRSTSRVSALIAQCERQLSAEPLLRVAIDRCLDLLRKELVPAPIIHQQSYPGTSLHA